MDRAVSVSQAAEQLGVDPSRVRRLLRSGDLVGEQVGRIWLVDVDALAHRKADQPLPRRPLAPARAWGLLSMLSGADASWLDPVARSRVRAYAKRLVGEPGPVWLAALRGRAKVHRCWVHPAALPLLRQNPAAVEAGAPAAVKAGADLVVIDHLPEFYVRPEAWPVMSQEVHARVAVSDPNVIVRVPEALWPFRDALTEVPAAALAADLLESREDRAARAGLEMLQSLADSFARGSGQRGRRSTEDSAGDSVAASWAR